MEDLSARIAPYLTQGSSGTRASSAIYADAVLMQDLAASLGADLAGQVDLVAAPESMGFILGSRLASTLGVGFLPMKRGGNSRERGRVRTSSYIDHRDQVQTLEVLADLIKPGCRILFVDDWVGTAATVQAAISLFEDCGATVTKIAAIGATYSKVTAGMIDSGMLRYGNLEKN